MQKFLTAIALRSIKLYQTYISPYKRFSCAHRVATNEISCSSYGAKVIKRFGLFTGYKLLNRRFYDCSWHSKNLKALRLEGSYMGRNLRTRYQQGDVDCGGCSGGDCGDCSNCGDLLDFKDCFKKKQHSAELSAKIDKKNKIKYNTKL